jgi:hypothetical protein
VAPLWDPNGSADEVGDNDDNAFADDDSCSNLPLSNAMKGPSVASNQGSKEKGTKFMIDATVAKQLLKELLVDPLSYSDFDHIPPITQAQLDFLLARVDSVVQPVSIDDNVEIGLEVDEQLNLEPIPDNDDDNDKAFFDKGHGKYSSVERLSIRLLRILRDIGAPFDTYGTIMEMVADAVRDNVFIKRRLHIAVGTMPSNISPIAMSYHQCTPLLKHNRVQMDESIQLWFMMPKQ